MIKMHQDLDNLNEATLFDKSFSRATLFNLFTHKFDIYENGQANMWITAANIGLKM